MRLIKFQHSALQYRLVPFTRPDQSQGKRVQLYIMDLASANGTFVNNNKIEPQKYVQLMEKVKIFSLSKASSNLIILLRMF